MALAVRLAMEGFDPAAELAGLLDAADGAGGIASFVGVARSRSKSGHEIDRLILEHHPRLTLRSLEEITRQAADRFDVMRLHVVHRCGEIRPGEAIVFAGAASAHRRAALQATDYLMDRLKTEALFWKREDGPSGSGWIEPTETDYRDAARWE